jgi:hypothetical protein
MGRDKTQYSVEDTSTIYPIKYALFNKQNLRWWDIVEVS